MNVIFNRLLIEKTATAIQRGVKPKKILKNPMLILSGETEKIIINKRGQGVQIFPEVLEQLRTIDKEWVDSMTFTWKTYMIPGCKYTEITDRKHKSLIKLIEEKRIPNCGLVVIEVPVEEWSYTIEKSEHGERVIMNI